MTAAAAPLVLIVDDDARNAKLARDVLHAAGLRTLEAASGEAGVVLAAAFRPNVILMDIRLPDLDGTEAVRLLKDDARTADLPVVALTSLVTDDDGAWTLGARFDGYLPKPIDVLEFAEQVRSFCR